MASIEKLPTGNVRARWRTTEGRTLTKRFPTEKAAQDFLAAVRVATIKGGTGDTTGGRVKFADYAEAWRTAQPFRPGTAVSADQHLRLHVYPVIGDRPLNTIKASDVQRLVAGMALSPSTVRVVYSRVTAVFNQAVRDDVLDKSPCRGIKLRRTGSAPTEILTVDQVTALADAIPARYRALVLFMAQSGLRPGETMGLTVDRVDFLRRTVKVDRQLVRVRGKGVELGEPKTDSSYRTVPLATVDMLSAHLVRFPAAHEWRLMFTNERGAPIQQHPFSSVWETARRRAGLPEWATPHDLRHFYASTLIRAGLSVKVVQARLGHKSATTTLDTYGHLWGDDDDRTREAVAAVFAPPGEHERSALRAT
ncbi:MAG: tyrosine-type recombinase/integrase [Acidimicrobiales bacterium]